jgi:type IV pilus assembly protein PilV
MNMMNSFTPKRAQAGALLLEALVAIVIFTIGVLALIGVQAAAMRSTSDSKIRLDAEFFIDQLVSDLTIDARAPDGKVNFTRVSQRYASTTAGVGYTRWRDRVIDVANGGLPGAAVAQPTVVITDLSVGPTTLVGADIVVFWRAPNDSLTAPPRQAVGRFLIPD